MATRHSLIFLFFFCVIHTGNTDDSFSYLTEKSYTWLQAKKVCVLPRYQDVIKINTTSKKMGWIDASVKYTPWTEYIGCFELRPDEINLMYDMKTGKQLSYCLKSCRDHTFIGLKHNRCTCLTNRTINANRSPCTHTEKEICKGDKNSICAKNNPDGTFAVYRKDTDFGKTLKSPGECMAIKPSSSGVNDLRVVSCTRKLFPMCLAEKENAVMKPTRANKWTSSFLRCTYNTVATHMTHDKEKESNVKGTYHWLPFIRQQTIVSPSDKNLDLCMAVYIKNGKLMTDVLDCHRPLPASCLTKTTTTTNTSYVVENSKVLDTTGIVAVTLSTPAVVVILVLIVFSVRRRVTSRTQQRDSLVNRYITLHRRQTDHRDIPGRNEETRSDSCYDYAVPESSQITNEDQRSSENYEDVFIVGSEQPSHDEIGQPPLSNPCYQSSSTDLRVNYHSQVRNEIFYSDVSQDLVVQGDHCSDEIFGEQSEERKYNYPSDDDAVSVYENLD